MHECLCQQSEHLNCQLGLCRIANLMLYITLIIIIITMTNTFIIIIIIVIITIIINPKP